MPATIFRKGLDLKHDVANDLARDYHSQLVEKIKESDYRWKSGRLNIYLAEDFGFCYGVDRAVDYAYQTRRRFPKQNVFLTGEIIHNPHVNSRMREAGVRFLSDKHETLNNLTPEDVVILPAFGVTTHELSQLEQVGCIIVDTTCGSVLNVWKAVRQYSVDRYTAIIHGKYHHEETRATASKALDSSNGRYLVILDKREASLVCDFILEKTSPEQFLSTFSTACSPDFNPKTDLRQVGLANQTTMLMSESLEIGDMIRQAMITRYGEKNLPKHFRAFETICSATQDRQDAVTRLLHKRDFSLAVVVGGYNSSNTRNLARICSERVKTFHIADASCLISTTEIRHHQLATAMPAHSTPAQSEMTTHDWLPAIDKLNVAITSGASTPDNIVGKVVERLSELATLD